MTKPTPALRHTSKLIFSRTGKEGCKRRAMCLYGNISSRFLQKPIIFGCVCPRPPPLLWKNTLRKSVPGSVCYLISRAVYQSGRKNKINRSHINRNTKRCLHLLPGVWSSNYQVRAVAINKVFVRKLKRTSHSRSDGILCQPL